MDKQTQSLHYFHSYAVKDRVDSSKLSDNHPSLVHVVPSTEDVVSKVLPTKKDDEIIRDYFTVLVARILCTEITYFKSSYADVVDWHIEHKFSDEMSHKSEVVSLCSYMYYILFVYKCCLHLLCFTH